MKHDWSKFNLKIAIRASVANVYTAWTVPQELENWFLRKAAFKDAKGHAIGYTDYIHEGDTYEWLWHGFPDDVVEKGKILHANGLDKLVFSFTGGGEVTVQIGEVAGETVVMLTQEKIPTHDEGIVKYHLGCLQGWTFYLANLKSYMEGGIDLRNKNLQLANVINS
jgi:uncharacterized protein YndB with AHSA1/START domain